MGQILNIRGFRLLFAAPNYLPVDGMCAPIATDEEPFCDNPSILAANKAGMQLWDAPLLGDSIFGEAMQRSEHCDGFPPGLWMLEGDCDVEIADDGEPISVEFSQHVFRRARPSDLDWAIMPLDKEATCPDQS